MAKAILFDCDGTLLDSIDGWDIVLGGLAADAGVTLTDEENYLLTTLSIPETGVFFHDTHGLGENADDVVSMIDHGMLAYYSNHAQERPGALDFVRSMVKLGVCCSVVSSSPQSYLQAGLERAGFKNFLYEIISVDDVGSSKREPKVFQHTARLMAATPAETWVFEDSIYALKTAKAAGFKTLGMYDRDAAGTFEQLSDVADIAVRSFEELDPQVFA